MKKLIAIAIFSSLFLSACSLNTVFVAGNFNTYEDQNAYRLLSIGHKGGKQPWFDPGASLNNNAWTVETNSKGSRIYLGGPFITYNGQPAGRIMVLDLSGKNMEGLEFFSGSGFDAPVHVIARDLHFPLKSDQRYIVGGEFTTYNGQPAPGVIRIMANGDIDPEFDPGTGVDYSPSQNPARVMTVAFDLNKNRTCFGGSFTSYNAVNTNNMICVLSNGRTIPSFNHGASGFTYAPPSPNPSYEGEVDQIAFDENYEKIYVGGRFNRFNGTEVDSLVRLGTDGDFEFNYQIEGQGTLRALFLLTETNAIITGGKSYTVETPTGPVTTAYNSLIKIDRDDGALIPGFAVTPGNGSDFAGFGYVGLGMAALADGEVVSPGKLYFAGGYTKLNASSGATFTYYNLQEDRPLLSIDKTTGAIDPDFIFADDFALLGTTKAANIITFRVFETPLFP